jgi:diguanylate cyclase (GGDEF)-like protein
LLIADVDFLKKINDRFGHVAGDEAILSVANTLKKEISPRDFCCRYGGDEFMVLIHPSTMEEVLSLEERIKLDLTRDNTRRGFGSFILSLSFGVAPLARDKTTEKEAIARADKELYQAKKQRDE